MMIVLKIVPLNDLSQTSTMTIVANDILVNAMQAVGAKMRQSGLVRKSWKQSATQPF
jgi:hypothetical protein